MPLMYSVDDTKSYFPVTCPWKFLNLFEKLKFTCLNYLALNVYPSSCWPGNWLVLLWFLSHNYVWLCLNSTIYHVWLVDKD